MIVYHAKTDPDFLTRLRLMLDSSARADIAVGYFLMSGFAEVMDDLSRLNKTLILVRRDLLNPQPAGNPPPDEHVRRAISNAC